jgi:hypothetical protein
MGTVSNLLTGRLWLRDTRTGRLFRRATLADVVAARKAGGTPFASDGRWCGFDLADHVGFALSGNTLAKLTGVVAW